MTREEIKKVILGTECCNDNEHPAERCDECPYVVHQRDVAFDCIDVRADETLAILRQLLEEYPDE